MAHRMTCNARYKRWSSRSRLCLLLKILSSISRHSLPVGEHANVGLSPGPIADTDFTLSGWLPTKQPIPVNVDRSASLGHTVGDDFVHNLHTGNRTVRRALFLP